MGRARDQLAPKAAQWLFATTLPRMNAVLTGYGQPPIRELFEVLDRCSRVLVMTSPSFDFPAARPPDNVRYVGPQLDDPPWAAGQTWRRPESEPLVLVATSSIFQHQTGLLQRIAQSLGPLPVRGLITTGLAVDPQQIHAPPNVEVVQAAPHRQVLAEASVVVTHAGHGTVLKALAAGVPLVCIPMGRDQKDNTVRMLRIGSGVRISKKATPHQMASAVTEILENPKLRIRSAPSRGHSRIGGREHAGCCRRGRRSPRRNSTHLTLQPHPRHRSPQAVPLPDSSTIS